MVIKKIIYSLALGMILLFSGCKKDSAVTTDTINPVLTFTIDGGGTAKTFTSGIDYSGGQFNMAPDTKYTYSLTIRDTGGVERLQLQLDKFLNLGALTSTPVHVETETSAQKIYTINGSAANPYTSFLMTGSFITPTVNQVNDVGLEIFSHGNDYAENSVHVNVNCFLTQSPPGGYGWVIF